MSTVFGIVKEEYILGNSSRISYGVAVYANAESEGTACIIQSVSDICDDYNKMCDFVRLCNSIGLSALHLEDAITDFLDS